MRARRISSASASVIGGSKPGRRCASIDLPVPGGPSSSSEWPPAAAISSARLASGWPRTSARSGASLTARRRCLRNDRRQAARARSDARTPRAATPPATRRASRTSAASAALACGQHERAAVAPRRQRHRERAAHGAQLAGQRQFAGELVAPPARRAAICPLAARMPIAIGRSKRPDSFGRSAGARLTVTLRAGNSNCAFCNAARTRSRASRTSVSGRPTRCTPGKPAGQVHFDADARRVHAGQSAAMDDCDGHRAARVTEQRAWRDGLATALIRLADARNAATQDGNHRRRPCRDRAI